MALLPKPPLTFYLQPFIPFNKILYFVINAPSGSIYCFWLLCVLKMSVRTLSYLIFGLDKSEIVILIYLLYV